jgi:hypothetical protein
MAWLIGSQDIPPLLKESIENSKVEYRRVGKSGLTVSVPIFGCMSFGDVRTLDWVIGEDEVSFAGAAAIS